jgi:hypothetical protein
LRGDNGMMKNIDELLKTMKDMRKKLPLPLSEVEKIFLVGEKDYYYGHPRVTKSHEATFSVGFEELWVGQFFTTGQEEVTIQVLNDMVTNIRAHIEIDKQWKTVWREGEF